MRKHTFSKWLSSALAFALAFTTVVPGNAAITASAAGTPQLVYNFVAEDGTTSLNTNAAIAEWKETHDKDLVVYAAPTPERYDELNTSDPSQYHVATPVATYYVEGYVAGGDYDPEETYYKNTAAEGEPAVYVAATVGDYVAGQNMASFFISDGNDGYVAGGDYDPEETYYKNTAAEDEPAVYVAATIGDYVVGQNMASFYVAGFVAATGTYVSGTTYYTSATGETQVDTSGFYSSALPADMSAYYVSDGGSGYTRASGPFVSGTTYYVYTAATSGATNEAISAIALPAVPEKAKYTGKWEYTDDAADGDTFNADKQTIAFSADFLNGKSSGDGYTAEFEAVYEQVLCDVTFTLTGVKGLKYQIIDGEDIGAVTALDMTKATKKIENIPVGATLRIVDVEADDFYEYTANSSSGYITSYTGLTVEKDNVEVSLTAETANNDAYYNIGAISVDTAVTVTVAPKTYTYKAVTFTDTTANKSVNTVEYYQLKKNSSGEWVTKGDKASATLVDGTVILSSAIEDGNKIKIVGFTYNTDAYEVVNKVEELHGDATTATAIAADADGAYTTAVIGEATTITLTTTKLAQSTTTGFTMKPVTKGGSTITPVLTVDDSSLKALTVDTETTKYIKAEGGFKFTLEPKDGSNTAITKVEYKIKGSDTAKEAVKSISGQTIVYTVPAADVQKAIVAGGAEIIATVDEDSYTVKVTQLEGATAEYTEYIVTANAQGKPVYTAVTGISDVLITAPTTENPTTNISVGTGHVIGIKVTPTAGDSTHNRYLLTANSVKNNGTAVAAAPTAAAVPAVEDDPYNETIAGQYMVDAATNALTIKAYAPVNVSVVEAKKTKTEDGVTTTLKTYTSTGINEGGDAADATASSKRIVTGKAITFKSILASDAARTSDGKTVVDYYATLATPTVKRGTDKAITATYDKTNKTYTISKADVEAAIEAGEAITITAGATEKTINTVKISVAKGLTGVVYEELDPTTGNLVLSHPMSSSTTGPDKWTARTTTADAYALGEFQAGNYVRITAVSPSDSTTFVKVTSGNTEIAEGYTVSSGVKTYNGEFGLGYIGNGTEYAVSTATLAAADIEFSGDVDTRETAYITGTVGGSIISGSNILNSGDAPITLDITSTDTVNDYKIASPVTYTVAKDKTTFLTGQLDTKVASNGAISYSLSRDALKSAAVNGAKITITANLKVVGYKTQNITVKEATGAAVTITANDKSLLNASGVAPVTYGQNAKVSVKGKPGYTLGTVSYVSAAKAEAKIAEIKGAAASWTDEMEAAYVKWLKEASSIVTVVTAKNNAATFTISKVAEPLYLYCFTEESYSLVLGTGEDAIEAYDGQSFARAYNEGALAIKVVKGTTSQILDSTKATVKAEVGDEAVTDAVFGTITSGATSLSFNPESAKKTHGKTVAVTITQLVSGTATPEFSFTVKFAVSEPITTNIVDFTSTKDIVLPLGTKYTIPLTTAKKGFTKDVYVAKATPATGLTITKSADGKSLVVYADPDAFTAAQDYTVKLYDQYDAEITSTGVKVSVNTKQVKEADLSKITAVAETDAITFNFATVKADEDGYYNTATEGLYYLINASQVEATTTGFVDIQNKLVPASAKSVSISVVTNESVLADIANPVKYSATVKLVQIKNYDKDETYNNNSKNTPIIASDDIFTDATLATVIDSIFATRITFKKNTLAPKKIYSTMTADQAFVLGTINFPDVAKNTPVTAQRISRLELLDSTGAVIDYATTGHDGDHVSIDGKDVVFNVDYTGGYDGEGYWTTTGLSTGKYNIVAYALEPRGKEVTCKIPVTIVQGIERLSVSAPTKLYKASGKAAKITAKVAYYPTAKPVPATKKVTWSLLDETGTEALAVPGITVKNGTVSLAKDVVIPSDGLKFIVMATAADYVGHDDVYAKALQSVEVYSTSMNVNGFTLTIDDTELINGKSYYSSEISGSFKLYDSDNNVIRGVKYTVSGITGYKDSLGNVYGASATKATGSATITAALTDGSNVKKTVKINIKSDVNMRYSLANATQKDATTFVNDYDANTPLYLFIEGENSSQISHSVAFNGFKKTKTTNYYDGTQYIIVPTKNAATITITDKTRGNAKLVLKVTNTKFASASVKTSTKVTASNVYETGYNAKTGTVNTKDAKGKIFSHLEYASEAAYQAAGSFNKVTYTVTDGKTPLKNKKVYINTATDTAEKLAFAAAIGGDDQVITLDEKGQFVIDYQDDGKLNLKKGTYSFTVTPVNDDGEAIAKSVVVKVGAAPAPKANVVMNTTSFTKFSSEAAISFKTMNNIVFTDKAATASTTKVVNGVSSAEFTGNLLGINTKGKINKFATVFEISATGDKLTCKKSPKNYDEGYTAKPSAGMQGWIQYSWTNLDGSTGSTYVKVKVTPASGSDIVAK